jgi:hypothetical protein
MVAMAPWLRLYTESFDEALHAARAIEWGFEVRDAGEADVTRTIDLDDKTKRELDAWLNSLATPERQKEHFRFHLGTGHYTKPGGSQASAPFSLRIRRLSRSETRAVAADRR